MKLHKVSDTTGGKIKVVASSSKSLCLRNNCQDVSFHQCKISFLSNIGVVFVIPKLLHNLLPGL